MFHTDVHGEPDQRSVQCGDHCTRTNAGFCVYQHYRSSTQAVDRLHTRHFFIRQVKIVRYITTGRRLCHPDRLRHLLQAKFQRVHISFYIQQSPSERNDGICRLEFHRVFCGGFAGSGGQYRHKSVLRPGHQRSARYRIPGERRRKRICN